MEKIILLSLILQFIFVSYLYGKITLYGHKKNYVRIEYELEKEALKRGIDLKNPEYIKYKEFIERLKKSADKQNFLYILYLNIYYGILEQKFNEDETEDKMLYKEEKMVELTAVFDYKLKRCIGAYMLSSSVFSTIFSAVVIFIGILLVFLSTICNKIFSDVSKKIRIRDGIDMLFEKIENTYMKQSNYNNRFM